MAQERKRNEDARGGDVLVTDSIASGKPDLPIDRDPGGEANVAIDADELRGRRDRKEVGRETSANRDAASTKAGGVDETRD